MGNNCCKRPEEQLVVDTIETIETNINDTKDKYPHDSDSAFKNQKYQNLKTELTPITYTKESEE